jgi:hypothetical protein
MLLPHKPFMLKESEREFEKIGLEEVSLRLAANRGGQYLYVTHGPLSTHAQGWVRWKKEREACLMRVGIYAAVAAAFLALLACGLTLFAWQFPVTPPSK